MNSIDLSLFSWRFREANDQNWLPATVPGCVHSDLLRANAIPDPFFGTNELDLQWIEERDWEYETTFDLAPDFFEREENIDLVADGLDTVAVVSLNGEEIAETDNMFIGWRWAVKDKLKAGPNRLRILFKSAMGYIRSHNTEHSPRECLDHVGGATRIRKMQCQFGWDWGPRLVTAGVWRAIRLETWSTNRIVTTRIIQDHSARDGSVTLTVEPESATKVPATLTTRIHLDGKEIAREQSQADESIRIRIPDARIWWPAGQGEQPLYDVEIMMSSDGRTLDTCKQRIGLRTIILDRHPDQWGQSFQFTVNGRPVFIKGANWIPAHSFVGGLTRADYARDLNGAVQANMNAVRVWGGGIYESDDFYNLCDELGLLVWQDFMFSCTLYPYNNTFVKNVRAEADFQIRRLRNHASLALWCGNNELVQAYKDDIFNVPGNKAGYERVFHETLPAAVEEHDGVTCYWPSSEWSGDYENALEISEKRGDKHFWDVWHARKPVKDYEKWSFRFVSEFGMQSYSSPETNATFCPPCDANVFGPIMENHQKNPAGNQIILDYVSRRYRFPKSQEDLIYLSQLNQAYCMQTAVEHYRRLAPRCMGAIYWQLNDCWPVTSWSSIEFTGRWKALHHIARRFFAPAIVTAHIPGDEYALTGNYRRTSVNEAHIYTVYDAPFPARGTLRWDIFHLDGRVLLTKKKSVALRYGESTNQVTLKLGEHMRRHGRDNIILRIALDIEGSTVSQDTVFLSPPRFLPLPQAQTKIEISQPDPRKPERFRFAFTSPVFQHRFVFCLPGLDHEVSDNYFELYPNETKEVFVTLAEQKSKSFLEKHVKYQSLVESYL